MESILSNQSQSRIRQEDPKSFNTRIRGSLPLHCLIFCVSVVTWWVLSEDPVCGRFYRFKINGTKINNSGSESAVDLATTPHTHTSHLSPAPQLTALADRLFALWFRRKWPNYHDKHRHFSPSHLNVCQTLAASKNKLKLEMKGRFFFRPDGKHEDRHRLAFSGDIVMVKSREKNKGLMIRWNTIGTCDLPILTSEWI